MTTDNYETPCVAHERESHYHFVLADIARYIEKDAGQVLYDLMTYHPKAFKLINDE